VIARLDVKPSLGVVKSVAYEGLRRVGDALQMAQAYEDQGADEILVLDTTASLYGRVPDLEFLRRLTSASHIPLTYGGGIQTLEQVHAIFRHAGVEKVALNTAAVTRPDLITELAEEYGSQAVVLNLEVKRGRQAGTGAAVQVRADSAGADARGGGAAAGGAREGVQAYCRGGRDLGHADAIAWAIEATRRGAGEVLGAAVDRDGTRLGLDHALLVALHAAVTVPVVLSGGAADAADVVRALAAGASGVAIASLLHSGETTIQKIKFAAAGEGIEVRL
jgi:cyclase